MTKMLKNSILLQIVSTLLSPIVGDKLLVVYVLQNIVHVHGETDLHLWSLLTVNNHHCGRCYVKQFIPL